MDDTRVLIVRNIMSESILAGVMGGLISAFLAFAISQALPIPATSLDNSLAAMFCGLFSGLMSGFVGVFIALKKIQRCGGTRPTNI
jgi:hypothetical protein